MASPFPVTPNAEVMSGGQPEPSGLACADSLKAMREIVVAEKDSVVVPMQREIRVFVNNNLDVVVRQDRGEDHAPEVISINPRYVQAICRAMREAAKQAKAWAAEEGDE